MHPTLITNDERPTTIDSPATPIFMKGHGACRPPFFPIHASNTVMIYRNNHIAFEFPNLHDQNSLTLC